MKQLDLRAIGLDELHPDEMRNVEGGFLGFIVLALVVIIGAAVGSAAATDSYYGWEYWF